MHEREYGTTGSYGNGYGSSSGGYDGNNPNGGYGDFGGFDFGGFDFGGFGNFAVTPVSISRDDPARPVTKVTFYAGRCQFSLIMAAIRKQSMF